MLNRLDVRLNDQIAGYHDRAGQRHQGEPASAQNHRTQQNPKTGSQLALEARPARDVRLSSEVSFVAALDRRCRR